MTTGVKNMTPRYIAEIQNPRRGQALAGRKAMAELTVGAGLARGLISLAVSKGADGAELAARAGIELADLEDQDNRVAMPKYIALMRAAKELAGDPALALHWGETVDLSEISIVGLIMNASETMMDAFVQMNRFGKLAIEWEGEANKPRFQNVLKDGAAWLVDTRANPNDFPELTEVTFARQTCGPRRFLPRPHVLEVHVTHAAPAYRAEYDRIFQCPVVFESSWNAMRMDMTLASHRVALQPRYVFGVLSERAEQLLRNLETSRTARGRVESLLMPILHTGDIGMDTIASKMALSRPTLLRRLKAEGVTFEQVLDELRHQLALHYLSGKKASVNETAYLVGFSDPASFSRAFKRWTGKSPKEMRAASLLN
jgi:AraC-like DNA-binding protein